MKKTTLFFILIIALGCSCTTDLSKRTVILSGQIKNPYTDSLTILNSNYEVINTIVINADNSFKDTLVVTEGYYRLDDGNESTPLFLKPNDDLFITLNSQQFDASITYEGKGAHENNYLAKKTLLVAGFGKLTYYGYYAKLAEKAFLSLTDSLYDVQTKLLDNTPSLDESFRFIEQQWLKYEMLEKLANFEKMKRFVTGNTAFHVSDRYPDAFTNIDLSNEKLLLLPNYLPYLRSYLIEKTHASNPVQDKNIDYTIAYLNTIVREVQNSAIKEALVYQVGKTNLNDSKHLDSLYIQLSSLLTQEKHLTEVTQKYHQLKKVAKGAVSPVFELEDIHGEIISLTDLAGKLVYIDIWATWCLPCIKEIPSLKKLETYFEGKAIHFVSICKEDTKEKWKKMVNEQALGGIQLFAPTVDIPFFNDYLVQGVPRFILIDENGHIIDANVNRPSDPTLQATLEKLLK